MLGFVVVSGHQSDMLGFAVVRALVFVGAHSLVSSCCMHVVCVHVCVYMSDIE